MGQIQAFLTALSFLSRIRLGRTGTDLGAAYGWFPLVGAVIGAAGGAVLLAVHMVGIPAQAGAMLAVGAMVLLTGALHEDGLADTADGLGAGADRDRALAIMKDSRIGSFGVLALVLVTGLRVTTLAALPASQAALGLVVVAVLSRAVLPFLARFLPRARPDGLGAAAGRPDRSACMLAGVFGLLLPLAIGLAGGLGVLVSLGAVAGAAATALALGWLLRRRLGGYTGDTLGAAQQLVETVCLLILVVAP